IFVEPIALYPVRDLYPNDGKWSFPFPPQDQAIDIGEEGIYGPNDRDLLMVTYGNGVPMCLRVQDRLARSGRAARGLNLRVLAAPPEAAVRAHARKVPRVLAVDECRRSGNVSEAIATCLFEDDATRSVRFARVTAADSLTPLGDASRLVLPDEDEIHSAA